MDIRDFPLLAPDEFAEACHHLDNRYRQATLGPLRREWRLRLCTALDLGFSSSSMRTVGGDEYGDGLGHSTYLQILRPLREPVDPGDISRDLAAVSLSDGEAPILLADRDMDMLTAEEADAAVIGRERADRGFGSVTYEIHLHPTYRVPCLWFTLHDLPPGEAAFSIDTVFRHLVPDEYKDGLRRGIGGIGGISADHHPITGVPAFFVHPCLLGDAISSFRCSRQNYLMIWLGLVGGCVGLWVPKEMAMP